MEGITRAYIKLKVAFAVMVYDDFSGIQLKGNTVQITIPGQEHIKPVVKQEGYYIILSGTEKVDKISITAYGFETETVNIDYNQIDPMNPVLKIRMMPDKAYSLSNKLKYLEGFAEPETTVYAVNKNNDFQLKLLMDYIKGDSQICIFSSVKENYEGKTFVVYTKNKAQELVTFQEKIDEENEIFKLYKPLTNDYQKLETVLCPIYKAKTEKNGKYFMPVKGDKENIEIIDSFIKDVNCNINKKISKKGGK